MDLTSIIFIGLLIFVGCAVIAVLIYVFQPKYAKESRMFSKKEKTQKVKNKKEELPSTNNTVSSAQTTNSVSATTISPKPLFSKDELDGYSKLLGALRNKNVIILSKVNFSDFVSISSGTKSELYKIIPYLKADYLICDDKTGTPLYIIKDTKKHVGDEYTTYIKNIAQTLKIGYIEIDGVNDSSIAQIFATIR